MEVYLHLLLTLTLGDGTGTVYTDPFTNPERRRASWNRKLGLFRGGLNDLEKRTISYPCPETDHVSSRRQFFTLSYAGSTVTYINLTVPCSTSRLLRHCSPSVVRTTLGERWSGLPGNPNYRGIRTTEGKLCGTGNIEEIIIQCSRKTP